VPGVGRPILLRFVAGALLIPLWKLHLLSLRTLKQFFFGFLKGRTEVQVAALAVSFMERLFRKKIFKEAGLRELAQLRAEGYVPVLASASPEPYVREIAARLEIVLCAATRYEIREGRYTGKMEGADCRGEEKVPRIAALVDLQHYDRAGSVAYSDSRADLPLLALAGRAYLVDKKRWQTRLLNR
jgi:HAD superfamily hydrolase (TIGR01490 family)